MPKTFALCRLMLVFAGALPDSVEDRCSGGSCGHMGTSLLHKGHSRSENEDGMDTAAEELEAEELEADAATWQFTPFPTPSPEAISLLSETLYNGQSARDAQFLIQASFGPTRDLLANLSGTTYVSWIQNQMHMPATSHREYFRARLNARWNANSNPETVAWLRGPCASGVRWNEYALNKADIASRIEIKHGEIHIDNVFRTAIEQGAFASRWSPWTAFTGFVCEVVESIAGDVKISVNANCNDPILLTNPRAFLDGAPNVTMDLRIVKHGAWVLGTAIGDCPASLANADTNRSIIVQSHGKFYKFDPRYSFVTNTMESPSSDVCAPKHPLNEQFCQVPQTASYDGCFFRCGSPGEIQNNAELGHQFDANLVGVRPTNLDNKYSGKWQRSHTKQAAWVNVVLHANDTLRQRVAWALSQVFVVSEVGMDDWHQTERWLSYYDIFVRNAFGNFLDIMKAVTFHPVMGNYLTHLGSSSFDFDGTHANENYAREIMQLFTLGVQRLNANGSVKTNGEGEEVLSYTSNDILSLARVFTGLGLAPQRKNLEQGSNFVDPMQLNVRKHDVHPKTTISHQYVGSGFPSCADALPPRLYLTRGSRYEFLGTGGENNAFALKDGSALLAALCSGAQSAAACTFSALVLLPEDVQCFDNECQRDLVSQVRIGSMYYLYKPPVCVHDWVPEPLADETYLMNFDPQPTQGSCYETNGKKAQWGITLSTDVDDTEAGRKKCLDLCKAAGVAGCEMHAAGGSKYCKAYGQELNPAGGSGPSGRYCWVFTDSGKRGYSYRAHEMEAPSMCPPELEIETLAECRAARSSLGIPDDRGFQLMNRNDRPRGCAVGKNDRKLYWNIGAGTRGAPIWWLPVICRFGVTVHDDSQVSAADHSIKFTVSWRGSGNVTPGTTTVNVTTASAYTPDQFETVPWKVTYSLAMGAHPPTTQCSFRCDQDVKYFYGPSGVMDADTIVETKGKYYKNFKRMVTIGDSWFEMPLVFLRSTMDADAERSVYAEITAALESLLMHSNTPVFVSKKLIQRFVTSNPSPDYVYAVQKAFKSGWYNGVRYGAEYGDMAATMAAVLLHPEARESKIATGAETTANGALREPILKIMAFMRAMEYADDQAAPVAFLNMDPYTGQFPFRAETVFNFYMDDFPLPATNQSEPPLLSPEHQILIPGMVTGFLNIMMSLVDAGVSHGCNNVLDLGIEGRFLQRGRWFKHCPAGRFAWQDLYDTGSTAETVNDLDLLLTGGRLSPASKQVVAQAHDRASPGAEIQAAQKAIAMTAEFHTMGPMLTKTTARDQPQASAGKAASSYKAAVLIYLNGGADTWNLLVPRGCHLQDEYNQVRTDLSLSNGETLQISTLGQPCADYGVHASLPFLQHLYNDGDLAFVSHIGSLAEPMTPEEYRSGSKQRCRDTFSHSTATNSAFTLKCQDRGQRPKGAGGRIADALGKDGRFTSSSFSMTGSWIWSSGFDTRPEILSTEGAEGALKEYEAWRESLGNITMQTHGNVYADAYTQALLDGISSTEMMARYLSSSPLKTNYQATSAVSQQMRNIAKLVSSRAERKAERDIFFVHFPGWDHHGAALKKNMESMFGQLNDAMKSFVQEMKAQGVWNDMAVFTHSEFGRTLDSNGGGSDHAWSGQHWIAGGAIKGKRVLGQYPDTLKTGNPEDLGRGRMVPRFPWESMMQPVAKWLGVKAEDEATVFPNIGRFNASYIFSDLFK